jgi:pentatricopeptide repeat protein
LIFMCSRPCADSALAEIYLRTALAALPSPAPPTVYAAYLAVCARAGDAARADAAWSDVLATGVSPSCRAVGAYVDCLARADRADDARRVLAAFPAGDTLVSRTSIVSGLARVPGREDEALAALREIRKHGFVPNCRAYTAVTHGLGKARRSREAVDLLHAALDDGVEPDSMLYESVICACGACADVDGAFSVLASMRERGLEMSDRAFEGLIYACGSAGRTRRACIVFSAAEAAKLDTPRVVSAFASALLRRGVNDERAVKLMARMEAIVQSMSAGQPGRAGVDAHRFRSKLASVRRIVARPAQRERRRAALQSGSPLRQRL